MPYPFYCPQRHQLQAELTAIGQVAQCPVCGTHFLVPAPDFGAMTTRNAEGLPGLWQAAATAASLPIAMAVEPPAGPQEAAAAPGPPPPAFATLADAVFAGLANIPAATESRPAAIPPTAEERPAIDLGFDPRAKAALPFELPGQGDFAASETAAARPAPIEPPGSFLAGPAVPAPLPATEFPATSTPADDSPMAPQPGAALPAMASQTNGGGDLLAKVPAVQPDATRPLSEGEGEPAETPPLPKLLHIRCPLGHVLKAPSDLLGKLGRCPACKKTFELRYEDSLEFQRRTAKILRRDQHEAGREWLAWTFGVAFLLFAALAGAVLLLRH